MLGRLEPIIVGLAVLAVVLSLARETWRRRLRRRKLRAAWARLQAAGPFPPGEIVVTAACPASVVVDGETLALLLGFHERGIAALAPSVGDAFAIAPGGLVEVSRNEFQIAGTAHVLTVRSDAAAMIRDWLHGVLS